MLSVKQEDVTCVVFPRDRFRVGFSRFRGETGASDSGACVSSVSRWMHRAQRLLRAASQAGFTLGT